MVLYQIKVDEKSNEITAIPKLLEMLELSGCIVTIDAIGCQKDIAEQIADQGADYVLILIKNQEHLYEQVKSYLEQYRKTHEKTLEDGYYESKGTGHGRIEIRRHWIVDDLNWLDGQGDWKNLQCVAMVEAERRIGDKVTTETRYGITSLERNPMIFAHVVRKHWGIENKLHWTLEVAFREDDSSILLIVLK